MDDLPLDVKKQKLAVLVPMCAEHQWVDGMSYIKAMETTASKEEVEKLHLQYRRPCSECGVLEYFRCETCGRCRECAGFV